MMSRLYPQILMILFLLSLTSCVLNKSSKQQEFSASLSNKEHTTIFNQYYDKYQLLSEKLLFDAFTMNLNTWFLDNSSENFIKLNASLFSISSSKQKNSQENMQKAIIGIQHKLEQNNIITVAPSKQTVTHLYLLGLWLKHHKEWLNTSAIQYSNLKVLKKNINSLKNINKKSEQEMQALQEKLDQLQIQLDALKSLEKEQNTSRPRLE